MENLAPHLANLTQLSLEDNLLTTLRGISGLDALMELYVGNNQIAELREVLHLKPLPKLIVLDALGADVRRGGERRRGCLRRGRRVPACAASR